MFKNRSLQVKMIKDDEMATDELVVTVDFEHKVYIVSEQIKSNLLLIGCGILTYVLADTMRQVAIERSKR